MLVGFTQRETRKQEMYVRMRMMQAITIYIYEPQHEQDSPKYNDSPKHNILINHGRSSIHGFDVLFLSLQFTAYTKSFLS
jgi:hypothetical protein